MDLCLFQKYQSYFSQNQETKLVCDDNHTSKREKSLTNEIPWNKLKIYATNRKKKCKNNFGKNLANDLVFKQVPNALKKCNFDENTG